MRELIRIDLTKWGVDSGKEKLFDGIDNVLLSECLYLIKEGLCY